MMYEEDTNVPQVLRQVRMMKRFFAAIDVPPLRKHRAALHVAYMDVLQTEIAEHALDLALAVIEWEDSRCGK